jgi:competence protein ComEA
VSAWLERNRSVVLTALAAVIVIGLVLLALQQRGGPKPLELRFDDPALDGAAVEVYVTGAVAHPGVYALHDGDRIADALDAAGGTTEDADVASLNLAKRVHDEGEVVVRSRGSVAGASVTATPAINQKVDINSASAEELNKLPGIGTVYSKKIVESRDGQGPFGSTDDLVTRQVIPPSTYDKIKDLITVSH